MHDHYVAHRCVSSTVTESSLTDCNRDISILNVMLDAKPMYTVQWHPVAPLYNRNFTGRSKHYSRTERPPKYYYIDFGLSRKYNPDDGPPRELPIFGGDKSVPEFQDEGYNKPADPFATDVYYLGNLIRTTFLGVRCFRSVSFWSAQIDRNVVLDVPRPRVHDGPSV